MKVVTFGEVMLRLAAPQNLRFSQANNFEATFGGGEANVAVSLSNYKIPVEFISRIPLNDIGESCIMNLKQFGVGTNNILRGGERLGIYFLEKGSVSRGSKVVYDRAYSSISQIEKGMFNWDILLKDATWFHWTGITPAISESAAMVCLEGIKAAKNKGLTVSCDLNYRKNLWKWGKKAGDVMPELVHGCDIILGNEEDAEKIFGIKAGEADISSGKLDPSEYQTVCMTLMERFPNARKIIITLRGSINADYNTWSGVLYDGKQLYHAPVYQITDIVDRVGGGDSFMAGLIYGLMKWPEEDQRALNFAVAASCLKHTIHGDYNLVTVSEVEQLMKGDGSGRVVR